MCYYALCSYLARPSFLLLAAQQCVVWSYIYIQRSCTHSTGYLCPLSPYHLFHLLPVTRFIYTCIVSLGNRVITWMVGCAVTIVEKVAVCLLPFGSHPSTTHVPYYDIAAIHKQLRVVPLKTCPYQPSEGATCMYPNQQRRRQRQQQL